VHVRGALLTVSGGGGEGGDMGDVHRANFGARVPTSSDTSSSASDSTRMSFGSSMVLSGSYRTIRNLISSRLPAAWASSLAIGHDALAQDGLLADRLGEVDLTTGFVILNNYETLLRVLELPAVPRASNWEAQADEAIDRSHCVVHPLGIRPPKDSLQEIPYGQPRRVETRLTRSVVASVLAGNGWRTAGGVAIAAMSTATSGSGERMQSLPDSFGDAVCFISGPFAHAYGIEVVHELYSLLFLAANALRRCHVAFRDRFLSRADYTSIGDRLLRDGVIRLAPLGRSDYRSLRVAVRNGNGSRWLPDTWRAIADEDASRRAIGVAVSALTQCPLRLLAAEREASQGNLTWRRAIGRLYKSLSPECAMLLRAALSLAASARVACVNIECDLSAEAVLGVVLASPDATACLVSFREAAARNAVLDGLDTEHVPTAPSTLWNEAVMALTLMVTQIVETDGSTMSGLQPVDYLPPVPASDPSWKKGAAPRIDTIRVATCNIDSASAINVMELCNDMDRHNIDIVALQETAVKRVCTLDGTLAEGFLSLAIPSPTTPPSGTRARRGLGFIARSKTVARMDLDTYDDILCNGQLDVKETEVSFVRVRLRNGHDILFGSLYSPPTTFGKRASSAEHITLSTSLPADAWKESICVDLTTRAQRLPTIIAGDFNEETLSTEDIASGKFSLSYAIEWAGMSLVSTADNSLPATFRSRSLDRVYVSQGHDAVISGTVFRGDGKHRLLYADVSTTNFAAAPPPAQERLRLGRLRDPDIADELVLRTAAALEPLLSIDADAETLEAAIGETASIVLGTTRGSTMRKMNSWWTGEVKKLIKARARCRRRLQRLRRKLARPSTAAPLLVLADACLVAEAELVRSDRVARSAVRRAKAAQREEQARRLMESSEAGFEQLRRHYAAVRFRAGKRQAAGGPSAERSAKFLAQLYRKDSVLADVLRDSMGTTLATSPSSPTSTTGSSTSDSLSDMSRQTVLSSPTPSSAVSDSSDSLPDSTRPTVRSPLTSSSASSSSASDSSGSISLVDSSSDGDSVTYKGQAIRLGLSSSPLPVGGDCDDDDANTAPSLCGDESSVFSDTFGDDGGLDSAEAIVNAVLADNARAVRSQAADFDSVDGSPTVSSDGSKDLSSDASILLLSDDDGEHLAPQDWLDSNQEADDGGESVSSDLWTGSEHSDDSILLLSPGPGAAAPSSSDGTSTRSSRTGSPRSSPGSSVPSESSMSWTSMSPIIPPAQQWTGGQAVREDSDLLELIDVLDDSDTASVLSAQPAGPGGGVDDTETPGAVGLWSQVDAFLLCVNSGQSSASLSVASSQHDSTCDRLGTLASAGELMASDGNLVGGESVRPDNVTSTATASAMNVQYDNSQNNASDSDSSRMGTVLDADDYGSGHCGTHGALCEEISEDVVILDDDADSSLDLDAAVSADDFDTDTPAATGAASTSLSANADTVLPEFEPLGISYEPAHPDRPPLSCSGKVGLEEVLQTLERLAPDKAPGLDLLSGRLLQTLCLDKATARHETAAARARAMGRAGNVGAAREVCAEAVRRICSDPFESCTWPSRWKVGLTVVIPKGKISSDPKDGRGITLLPIFDKLAQRILVNRLHACGRRTALEQAGFVPGMGALQAAAATVAFIADRVDRKLKTVVVAMDVAKAFDRVSHDAIRAGLRRLGGDVHLDLLVKSLLADRECYVTSNGDVAGPFRVERGVPQGGVCSPFLFNAAVDPLYEELRPLGIRVGDDGGKQFDMGAAGFADDTLIVTESIANAQQMVDITITMLERIACNAHPAKTQLLTFGFTRYARQTMSINVAGTEIRPTVSLRHLGVSLTGDVDGRIVRNRDLVLRENRMAAASAVWASAINGIAVPMYVARMSLVGGLLASALYGSELDSLGWMPSAQGKAYCLSVLDRQFNSAIATVAGFAKRGGSRDWLCEVLGVPELPDLLAVRAWRLQFLLRHSPCPLQRAAARVGWQRDVGVARVARILADGVGLGAEDGLMRMMNPFCSLAGAVSELKDRFEVLIAGALRRPRASRALFVAKSTRDAAGVRVRPASTRMPPGLRYSGIAARSVIHLLHGTLAARRGRSAAEANASSFCRWCGLEGGDNAEHVAVHCLHPVPVKMRADWTARDVLLVLSAFAFDMNREVLLTRPKRQWIERVARSVDELSRAHARRFRGLVDDEGPVFDDDTVLHGRDAYLSVLETAVQVCSGGARVRNELLDVRVRRLDEWTSAARERMTGFAPDGAGLHDAFNLAVVPRVLQVQADLAHGSGIDPTEILSRRRRAGRARGRT